MDVTTVSHVLPLVCVYHTLLNLYITFSADVIHSCRHDTHYNTTICPDLHIYAGINIYSICYRYLHINRMWLLKTRQDNCKCGCVVGASVRYGGVVCWVRNHQPASQTWCCCCCCCCCIYYCCCYSQLVLSSILVPYLLPSVVHQWVRDEVVYGQWLGLIQRVVQTWDFTVISHHPWNGSPTYAISVLIAI